VSNPSYGIHSAKIQYVALQRSDECRAQFMAQISIYDPSMFVWIDEAGCDQQNSRRKYGYSIRSIAPKDHGIIIRAKRYSAISVMAFEGALNVDIVEETVNDDRFTKFTNNTLQGWI